MLYLWDWIKDKQILRSDKWLQISMLDTMVLGYSRTKDLDEETVQSGFVVLRKRIYQALQTRHDNRINIYC